jgi:hypothetical protein
MASQFKGRDCYRRLIDASTAAGKKAGKGSKISTANKKEM